MGQKNSKGAVSITNDSNRIRLRWRYNKVRYSINFSFYEKTNLIQARKIAITNEHDIALNCFDTSLVKYKPKSVIPLTQVRSIID